MSEMDKAALRDRKTRGCDYDSGVCACPSSPFAYEGCHAPDPQNTPPKPECQLCKGSTGTPAGFWECQGCGRKLPTPNAAPEPAGATLAAQDAPPVPEDTPEPDEARVRRYAEAIEWPDMPESVRLNAWEMAERVIAVADEEQTAVRGDEARVKRDEMERLRAVAAGRDEDYCLCGCSFDEPTLEAIKRAEAAEAEVERLTRECLDRENTETDARERLRQAEERLASLEEDRAHPYGT